MESITYFIMHDINNYLWRANYKNIMITSEKLKCKMLHNIIIIE